MLRDMSLATLRSEGEGVIERYRSRYRHSQPFLQRNVRKALQYLTMGSTLSSLTTSTGLKARAEALTPPDDEDEEDIRPAKRRKTSDFNSTSNASPFDDVSPRRKPFGHVTNESRGAAARLSEKLRAVRPSDFYGRSRSVTSSRQSYSTPKQEEVASRGSKTSIQAILPETPVEFKRALKVEVISIVPKPPTGDEPFEFTRGRKSPIDTKCRCSVALFCAKNDEDPPGPIRQQDYLEVYRKYKSCTLRTTFNDDGEISRKLILLEPFILSSEEFYVNRRKTNHFGEYEYEFDFGDKYYVQVTLEPVGSQKQWPPFEITASTDLNAIDDSSSDSSPVTELLVSGKVTQNDLCLVCSMPGLLDPDRQIRSVDLKVSYGSIKQKVPYGLQIKMQWSLPNKFCDLPTRIPKIESPRGVTSTAAIAETIPASPLTRKVKGELLSAPNSPVDRASRRRSNVPTYNLKTLSAQAQGKSPRARRNLRSKSVQASTEDSEGMTVTYGFGKADAAELGIKQQTSVVGLMCPFCNRRLRRLEDLRLHLHTNHTNFKFALRRSNTSRAGFFVEAAKQGPRSNSAERVKTFQLGRPMTLFDLEKYLNGDESWVKAREGPQHNQWPEHLIDRYHESSLSSSPHDSRHSSPNTSNDTDGVMDLDNEQPKVPIRPRKTFYVPKTPKPLYDTVTKRILQPGEEIPDSDDEKDEGWLHQKHRDIILDFTDVTDDEKDYITRWNPFIMEMHLTCEKYLPEACLRFVEANVDWFAERKSRKAEFCKLMETFIMRGVVEQQCLDKCADILRTAEKTKGKRAEREDTEMHNTETLGSSTKLRGILDCICGEHTQPLDRVICRGPVSCS